MIGWSYDFFIKFPVKNNLFCIRTKYSIVCVPVHLSQSRACDPISLYKIICDTLVIPANNIPRYHIFQKYKTLECLPSRRTRQWWRARSQSRQGPLSLFLKNLNSVFRIGLVILILDLFDSDLRVTQIYESESSPKVCYVG